MEDSPPRDLTVVNPVPQNTPVLGHSASFGNGYSEEPGEMSDLLLTKYPLKVGLPRDPKLQWVYRTIPAEGFRDCMDNEHSSRHRAQSLTDNIWMGSSLTAKNEEVLKSHEFTMLISVMPQGYDIWTRAPRELCARLGIRFVSIELSQAILSAPIRFQHANNVINWHLMEMREKNSQARILIFDDVGIIHPPDFAAGWLIETFQGVTTELAIEIVQYRRKSAQFSKASREILEQLEALVEVGDNVNEQTPSKTAKRAREPDTDDNNGDQGDHGSNLHPRKLRAI